MWQIQNTVERLPRWSVVAVVVIGHWGCNNSSEVSTPEYDDSLLEVVREEQANAREALKSYTAQYHVRIDWDEDYDGVHNTSIEDTQVVAYQQDSLRRFEATNFRDQNIRFAKDEKMRLGPQQYRNSYLFVTNDRECAVRRKGTGVDDQLNIWFHRANDELAPYGQNALESARGLDIVAHTFSLYEGFQWLERRDEDALREALARGGGIYHARKMHDESGEWIEVTYHSDGRIWVTARVDPHRGYATTKVEYDSGDHVDGRRQESVREVSVRELAGGVWVPHRITGSERTESPEVVRECTFRVDVEGLVLDHSIEPDQFNWRSLGYRGSEVYIYPEFDEQVRVSYLGKYLEPLQKSSESEQARADRYIRMLSY